MRITTSSIERLERKVKNLQNKVDQLQSYRLYSFLLFICVIVLCFFVKLESAYLPVIIIFVLAFTFLLIKYHRFNTHLKAVEQLRFFLLRQQSRQSGTYKLDDLPSYTEPFLSHPLSRDLDLIAEKSLYSLLSESLTTEGDLLLIERILNGSKEASTFKEKIIASKKDYEKDKRHYIKLIRQDKLHLEALSSWAQDKSQIPSVVFYSIYLAYIIFVISLFSPFKNLGLSIYVLTYAVSFTKLYQSYAKAIDLEVLFFSLKKHLAFLLDKKWISQQSFLSLKKVSRWISFLSVQANPLVLVILNFVFPWTAAFTHLLERAKAKAGKEVPHLIKTIKDWDFLFSLRSLYHYQSKNFATLSTTIRWQAEGLYHPLLVNPKKNSFDLSSDVSSLALITGSNMSGKSTFLRSIGINQVLANMGAPVFATSMTTWQANILSCLRVSDSLEHGLSYFYSEVLRLKEVLTEAQKTSSLFLVDEIFRGTNNKERFIGAKSYILALSQSPSIGVITTHDLDLVELDKVEPKIKNFHFHDEVRGDELYFSFELREGPSKTTNALQILRKVGLPVVDKD